jgi:hypothetical protein
MLTGEDRRRIQAEEVERLRIRRMLAYQDLAYSDPAPWVHLLRLFFIGAALGFALLSLYSEHPEPITPARVIVVEP